MRLSEIRGTLQAVPLAGDDGYDRVFDYEGSKVWPSRPFMPGQGADAGSFEGGVMGACNARAQSVAIGKPS